MKLIAQIAIGVFLGCVSAQLVIDQWHDRKQALAQAAAEKIRQEREQAREHKAEHIQQLILQSQQKNQPLPNDPATDFVPDDAETPLEE